MRPNKTLAQSRGEDVVYEEREEEAETKKKKTFSFSRERIEA